MYYAPQFTEIDLRAIERYVKLDDIIAVYIFPNILFKMPAVALNQTMDQPMWRFIFT